MAHHTFILKCLTLLLILLMLGQVAPNPTLAQDFPLDSDTVSTNQVRIVGGQDATSGEWPWQSRLTIDNTSLCGGSLIHPRWVLTAAHCVEVAAQNYYSPVDIQVRLGDHDRSALEASEQFRNVVQVIVHPERNKFTLDNDIALLKLDIPISLNTSVGIIPLATSPADDSLMEPGDLATVTGWGATSQGGSTAIILQEAQVPIVSNLTCDAAMTASITDNMLCAGFVEGEKDSCQGDSGGPLVVPDGSGGWKLAGVVSFGDGCAQPGKYGVYARVSRYIDWIHSYVNSPTGPNPVRNANFDLGQNGDWSETSTNSQALIEDEGLPVTPHSNSYIAWLGGINNEISIIDQVVTFSEKVTDLALYYQIRSNDNLCTVDFGYVQINGVSILPTSSLCISNVITEWVQSSADISSFAGRTVVLTFAATTDTDFPSSLLIDDVSVTTSPLPLFTIANFGPSSGRTGSVVTLNGGNFLDATEVLFNGAPSSFAVQSDSVLKVTVPAQASTGLITVKTAYSTTSSSQTFTVLQPLTVAKPGSGNGTVTSNPAGIECGGDCGEDYSHGTSVTLTAQPVANSIFRGWSGACTGNATVCDVNMNTARIVTATFDLMAFSVNVNNVGNGIITSNPGGINCGVDCSQNYLIDTNVTLTAQPASDSVFSGWSGACSGSTTDCIINVKEGKSVTATFTLKNYMLSVSKIGNGFVSSLPAGITCGEDCSEIYTAHTNIILTATPDPDFVFVGWSDACIGNETDCTVTMSTGKVVTARFDFKSFGINVDKIGHGTIASNPGGINCGGDCSETYPIGTEITLTAVPETHSIFVGWNGACVGTDPMCNVTANAAKNVTATFALKSFALTVSKNGKGRGSVASLPDGILCGEDCSEIYSVGTLVMLTALADSGSAFSGWSGACTGEQTTCNVIINEIINIGAMFELDDSSLLLPLINREPNVQLGE